MYQYRFTFLCSEEEKKHLAKLAARHHRSRSDVIRMLLRDAVKEKSKRAAVVIRDSEGKESGIDLELSRADLCR